MIEKAEAIWIDKAKKNQYADAMCVFEYINGVAKLEVAADTDFCVYVNGSFVGCGQYPTFPGKKVYEEFDLSAFVKNGENTLLITAYAQVEGSQTYKCDTPMLAFALRSGDKIYYSGENTKIRENANYESGELERVTLQLGYTYHYDAGAKEKQWQKPKIIGKKFNYIRRPVKRLVHKPIKTGKVISQGRIIRDGGATPAELMQRDFLSYREYGEIFDGKKIKMQPGGVYFVIDLGEEYAGLLKLCLTAARGTVIDIGWGEHLEDMRVRTSVGGRSFAVRYICSDGKQDFLGTFRRMAARYLQVHITNMTSDIEFDEIGIVPTDYPLGKTRDIDCGDFLFNEIMRAADRTLRLCTHEHYEDCPWREQALYAYDSYVQMLCGYMLYGEFEQARASLELMADGQRADGLLPICAPSDAELTIPSFSLHWIISLAAYLEYSGDIEFCEKMSDTAERILGAYRIENDIVRLNTAGDCWNFYEWSDGLDGWWNEADRTFGAVDGEVIEEDCVCNLLYITAVNAYGKICRSTGRKLNFDAEKIKAAAKEKFYDRERGLWRTRTGSDVYHELTQSLAYLSGADTRGELLEKIASGGELVKTTLSTSLFKYEALLSAGDKYRDAVKNEIAEIWGRILFSGGQTFWETEKGAEDFDRAGSRCHGWSAVPAYIICKYYAKGTE